MKALIERLKHLIFWEPGDTQVLVGLAVLVVVLGTALWFLMPSEMTNRGFTSWILSVYLVGAFIHLGGRLLEYLIWDFRYGRRQRRLFEEAQEMLWIYGIDLGVNQTTGSVTLGLDPKALHEYLLRVEREHVWDHRTE